MNAQELIRRADRLKAELARAAASLPDAKALQDALQDLFREVYAGRVASELDWHDVPGGRLFTDGELATDEKLESAYADFKLYITGLEPKRP